jgi:ferric-dicitrate binding protein FerR (iron transport regulator)
MNTKPPKPKLNRQILDEAADWFVDFRVGDVDSTARSRFDLWLRQSPEHIRAYMEIANTYVVIPALDPARKVDIQELIAYARSEGNVVPFDPTTRADQPPSRATQLEGESRVERGTLNARPSPRRHGRPRAVALAASIAVICVTASLLGWLAVQWHSTYTTGIGERRTVTLEDGSTIDLNARSTIRVKFSNGERVVELLEGQALFEVVKDKARPFIVRSSTAVVRVVGTQFDVYRKRTGTTVTVVEGRVAVFSDNPHPSTSLLPSPSDGEGRAASPPASSNGDNDPRGGQRTTGSAPSIALQHLEREIPAKQEGAASYSSATVGQGRGTPGETGEVFVSAGEQVTVTERPIPAPKQADVAAATAWTRHQLVFDGSPLSDVVDGFNRYNTRQIVIEGRALDDFHVSGVYSSTDPVSLIRFLRQQPGIDVTETDEGVRITRK